MSGSLSAFKTDTRKLLVVVLSVLVAICAISATTTARSAAVQNAARSVWDGVYTEEQARRGETVFKTECSYCHRDDLSGGFFDNGVGRAPALAGPRAFGSSFVERWKDLSIGEMVATIAGTMPQQKPATLTVQAYVDVVSYLLAKNDVPAGSRELPVDVDELGRIIVTERSK